MKHSIAVLSILTLIVLTFQLSVAQTGSEGMSYTIRVESPDQKTPQVSFTAAYTAFDNNADSKMSYIEKTTPFEVKVSGAYFLGMFQSTSSSSRLKVTLTQYKEGVLRGHADGSGIFNFLHGEPNAIGYGVPEISGVSEWMKKSKTGGE